jgi:hypothetical protein
MNKIFIFHSKIHKFKDKSQVKKNLLYFHANHSFYFIFRLIKSYKIFYIIVICLNLISIPHYF